MPLPGLTLFFPCFNEGQNIPTVIQNAVKIAYQVATDYEILIIDDGSSDDTAEQLKTFSKNPHIRLIRHPKNLGYGEAVKSGFRAAQMPWIFFSDGDGQFDLKEIPLLIAHVQEADIVAGYRRSRADPFYRLLNQKIFHLAVRFFIGLQLKDIDCAFKLIRRDVVKNMSLKSSGALINTEFIALALRNGARVMEVAVTHLPRKAGLPTGASPRVIGRAMREFWRVWWNLKV